MSDSSEKSIMSTAELQAYARAKLSEAYPEVLRKYLARIKTAPDEDIEKIFDQVNEYVGIPKMSAKLNFAEGAAFGSQVATNTLTDAFKAMAEGMGLSKTDLKDVTIDAPVEVVDGVDKGEKVEIIEKMEEVEHDVEQEANPLEF